MAGSFCNEIVFGGILIFLIALKFSKKTFWVEGFLIFLMITRAFDFVMSPSSVQSALMITLMVFILYYFVLDFVRLLFPMGILGSTLLMGFFYNGTNERDKIFSIALVLLLSVLATFFGRDRYFAHHRSIQLTQKQEKLMDELNVANYHLNGELLKQSIHLMNIEEAEAKFRALTSAINAAIFLMNEEDHVVYSNHWLYNNYGIRVDSVQVMSDFKKIFTEEAYGRLHASYRATQKTSESTILREIPLRLSNDVQIWLNVKFTTVDTSGVLITGFDVTERKRNEERIEKLSAVKDILIKLNPLMLQKMEMIDLFEYVLTHMMTHITHADLACILKVEDSKLKVIACRGYDRDKADSYQIEFEKSFVYKVTNGVFSNPIIINDIQEKFTDGFAEILKNSENLPIRSTLSTPIMVDGLLYGLINMDAFRSHVFSNEDIELMTFLSEQLGNAIKNQQALKAHI
ncbi:GAF domain/GGDEF domain protein [Fusibacter sp. 3D3]|nr:GAF domain/GGDEF domain protein [Fusibacter sp. 3D3]